MAKQKKTLLDLWLSHLKFLANHKLLFWFHLSNNLILISIFCLMFNKEVLACILLACGTVVLTFVNIKTYVLKYKSRKSDLDNCNK